MRSKILKQPIFAVNFRLQVGSQSEVMKYHDWKTELMGMCEHKTGTIVISIVKDKSTKHTFVNTIAHEVVHAVHFFYDSINDKTSSRKDEVQANITGWLVQELYNLYNKK